jgi:hypothetical protein
VLNDLDELRIVVARCFDRLHVGLAHVAALTYQLSGKANSSLCLRVIRSAVAICGNLRIVLLREILAEVGMRGQAVGATLFTRWASADDLVSFAAGGYARGLRTEAEMHKIDTDGDGKVSNAEWLAYQEKVFAALDSARNRQDQ